MHYVYSTLASDNIYCPYLKNVTGDVNIPQKGVFIKGGSGIANKYMYTPKGVVTEVTDQELEILEANQVFQMHKENGYILVEKRKVEPEKKIKSGDLKERDVSAPITPQILREGKLKDVGPDLKERV